MTTTSHTDTPQPYGRPVVSMPGASEHHRYYNTEFDVNLRAEDSGGRFFVARYPKLRAESAPPFHVHDREDELWIVHSGTFRFWIGGESLDTATTYDVGAGGVVYGPRHVPHTFQSIDGAGDVTVLLSPGGSQDYFLGVGATEVRQDLDRPDRLEDVGMHVIDRAPVDGR